MKKEKKKNPGKQQKEYLSLAAKAWAKYKKDNGITTGTSKSKKATGGKKAATKKTTGGKKKKVEVEEDEDE